MLFADLLLITESYSCSHDISQISPTGRLCVRDPRWQRRLSTKAVALTRLSATPRAYTACLAKTWIPMDVWVCEYCSSWTLILDAGE